MLKKIIKYDLLFIGKIYIPIFAGSISVTLLSVLLHRLNQILVDQDITALEFTVHLVDIFMFFILIAVPSLTFIFITAMFYRSVAGSEGYLTHTLPVAKRDIVIGKNLAGLCFHVLSVLIAVICILIFWSFADTATRNWLNLGSFWTGFVRFWQSPEVTAHLPSVLLMALLFLCAMMTQSYANIGYGFLCVSLGQMMNKHKIIYTILFGVVISFALSTVSSFFVTLFSLLFVGTEIGRIGDILNNHAYFSFNMVMLIALLVNLAFAAVCNFASTKLLTAKLNLE